MKTVQVDFNSKNMISTFTSDQFYDSWDIFIRELLQNAYDACYARQALEWSWGTEFLELEQAEKVASVRRGYQPKIVISYSSSNGMFFVEDNGIGINEEDLLLYVSRVGSCYYTSDSYKNQRLKYEPISQFGIGLCSCFRVSRAILIESRKDKSINTAWNVMDRQSLEPIAAKWFNGADDIEYIASNRKLVGTRVTLALLPRFAMNMSMSAIVNAVKKYMICQPIPIDIYFDKKKVSLFQPKIASSPSAYIVGITTLQVDTDLLEGYITLYNSRHKEMVEPSEIFQQGFRIAKNADEIGLKPEWIRHMAFRLNIKKRFLNLKITRDGIAYDDNFKQLREIMGQLILSYYQNNYMGLGQYLNDGRSNVLSEFESEMNTVAKALFVSVYLKGQQLELNIETIINGFLGQAIKIAFISQGLFDYYRRQYPAEFKAFLNKYNLIVFEKNREFFMQFLAPYVKGQRYEISSLPGITYIDVSADLHMKKSVSPYRKGYQAYPTKQVDDLIFCFVSNEQSGPFRIILNQNHRNVQLLEKCRDDARVNNFREVVIENIKQRIMNSKKHWDKIIDFGGSFVDEWKQETPMTVQAIWCLENDFADSLNAFIKQKFSWQDMVELGLEGLVFHRDDFINWWYMPRNK